jgi:hypothetical protein
MRVRRLLFVVLAVVATARAASAQTTSLPLAQFISEIVASGARIDSTRAIELGDFLLAQQLGGIPAQLNLALGFQLATTPFDVGVDTSKPGFESVPIHYAFGPSFTAHAGTIGRGKVSVSFNYQNVSQGSLDGIKLSDSQLGFVLRSPSNLAPGFGRDLVQESLSLRLDEDVASFGLVYGVTDRLDIGVGVPIVHLEMEGQLRAQVFGASPSNISPRPGTLPGDVHFFDVYPVTPGQTSGCRSTSIDIDGNPHAPSQVALFDMVELATRTVTKKCEASGIGDIIGHVRYRVNSSETNQLAIGVDASLPTGDADNLLGSNGTRVTGAVAWTGQSGRFLPHVSAGYTYGIGDFSASFNQVTSCAATTAALPATRATTCTTVQNPTPLDLKIPSEINFAGGTDIVFYRRLTIGADVFGRRIQDLTKFDVNPSTAPALQAGDPVVAGTLLQVKGTGATLLVGVASAQVALTPRTVLKANLMFPVKGDGLSPRMAFGAGLGVRY